MGQNLGKKHKSNSQPKNPWFRTNLKKENKQNSKQIYTKEKKKKKERKGVSNAKCNMTHKQM